MKNKVCVLLNGAKLSGKGVLAEHLQLALCYSTEVISCKDKLYELVQSIFCLTPEEFFAIYEDRDQKEVPRKEFAITGVEAADLCDVMPSVYNRVWSSIKNGGCLSHKVNLSVREALIYTSEVMIKPVRGFDFFGVARAKSVLDSKASVIIDDSSAAFNVNGEIRADEVYPLIDAIGQENILLLRIHKDGRTFDNDSRRFIPNNILDNTIDIHNNGTLEEYLDSTTKIVKQFIDERIGG